MLTIIELIPNWRSLCLFALIMTYIHAAPPLPLLLAFVPSSQDPLPFQLDAIQHPPNLMRVRVRLSTNLDADYLRAKYSGRLSKIRSDGTPVSMPPSTGIARGRHAQLKPWMELMEFLLDEHEGNITSTASEIMQRDFVSHADRLEMLASLFALGLEVQIDHYNDPWKAAYAVDFTESDMQYVGEYQRLCMRHGARLDYRDHDIFIRALHDGRLPLLAWLCRQPDASGQKFFDLVCMCGSAPITASKLAARILKKRADVCVKGTEGCFDSGVVLMELHGGWK